MSEKLIVIGDGAAGMSIASHVRKKDQDMKSRFLPRINM